ncbi:MAG: hypothetical protein HS113_17765 [Verrucomicrobiales bacterium]|nr:hypothetical protein [Verrucomicrobiales bacterium]
MSLAEIQHTVRELSETEGGNLAAWILDSLPHHTSQDAADDGVAEALRRRQQLDAGTARCLEAGEFWASLEPLRQQ